MALAATITWEVRSAGNANNGGGFKTGSGGTDRTQSDTPHVTFDGATIAANNGGASATITITGYTVIAGDVGNVVKITGGTNFTAGYYEITSVNTGASTWTLDRTCTTGAGAAMTGRMGGASDSLITIKDTFVAGNTIYVKGSFTHSATMTLATNAGYLTPIRIIGYTTTRTDGGQATITSGANSITLFGVSGAGYLIENITVTKAGGNTSVNGFLIQNSKNTLINCRGNDCTTNFGLQGTIAAIRCVSTGGATGFESNSSGSVSYSFCEAYNASTVCFKCDAPFSGSVTYNHCISVDSGIYGFHIRDGGVSVLQNCTCYSAANVGFYVESWNGSAFQVILINCLAAENAQYGFSGISAAGADRVRTINCAAYNNVSGISQYTTNDGMITLTADPFVTKAPGSGTGDYDLNDTAGGGAACRQLGYPTTMQYYTATTPKLNVGAGGFAAAAAGGGLKLIGGGGLIG